MHPVVGQCPVCGEELTVTQLHCRSCKTTIEGHFMLGRLARLSPEQVDFVETFIRCEGKINRVEKELGVSYPTVRARLDDVIVTLGYRPYEGDEYDEDDFEEGVSILSEEERRLILEDLSQGRITSAEAVARLRAEETDDIGDLAEGD